MSASKDNLRGEVEQHLVRAKGCIASGESSMKEAAEHIATAMRLDNKLTQRKVAERVGKSVGWVNGLLRWKFAGYKSDTPFGPQNAQKRAKAAAAFSRTEHKQETTKATTAENIDRDRARYEAEAAKAARDKARAEAEAAKAKAAEAKARQREEKARADAKRAEARRAEAEAKSRRERVFSDFFDRAGKKSDLHLNRRDRELLIKFLGYLGSEHAGERANAGKMADDLRKRLSTSWDALIVEAT